jgi:glycosyltransferase involved in cell wall biosynthesis
MNAATHPLPAVERPEELGALVSVCLLTYNHAHMVATTLQSILEQTVAGYEVIVSDDCSSDGTWEEIQKLAAKDSRIRAVRTPHNLGMAGNANFAVSQSSRRYVALLHHDDIYRADLLEKWASVLERHPDAGFAFNPYAVHGSDQIHSAPMPGECMDGHWLLRNHLFPRWGCVVRGTAMIRRNAWEALGGMRERFGLLADVDLWMRLAMRWQVTYVHEPVIALRQSRPEDYPEEYKETAWSWRRYRLLCEIHAANRLAYFDLQSIGGRLQWCLFRVRLSIETAKWLTYAVVRRKRHMLTTSGESATEFDLWPVRLLRWGLLKACVRPAAHVGTA